MEFDCLDVRVLSHLLHGTRAVVPAGVVGTTMDWLMALLLLAYKQL